MGSASKKYNARRHGHLVGVDEAGRGPLAGPIVVAAVKVPTSLRSFHEFCAMFSGLWDSKKLSPEIRERWFAKICKAREMQFLDYAVSAVGASIIDHAGIVYSTNKALRRSLNSLSLDPPKTTVLLDGCLYAPERFPNQETIIRGDEKERVIALASIVAKVYRDKKMVRYAKKFPHYGFERHKGYGTNHHYEAIKKYGICEIHRRSFLGGIGIEPREKVLQD